MTKEEVPSEDAQLVEVHDRAVAEALQADLGVRRGWRKVHGYADTPVSGEVRRAGQQLVRREAVADEGDGPLHQPSGRVGIEKVLQASEHFVAGSGKRTFFYVPGPDAYRRPDASGGESRCDGLRVGHGPGLHQGGGAVPETFDSGQGGRQLLVVGAFVGV